MVKVNVLCSSCHRRYSVEVPNIAGEHTIHCPYCSTPFVATIAQRPARQVKQKPIGADAVALKVRRCEIASNVAWLILGIVQCILTYTAAAGVWNVVNAIVAIRNVKNITTHNPSVIPYFEGRKKSLIVLAVVNLILGGVVGVVLVLFEWYVRDFVLRNRSAFEK